MYFFLPRLRLSVFVSEMYARVALSFVANFRFSFENIFNMCVFYELCMLILFTVLKVYQ